MMFTCNKTKAVDMLLHGSTKPSFRKYVRTIVSRNSKLESSQEAQRQLTMGHRLDPHNLVAPEVPILEEIFNDSDIYTRSSVELATTRYPFVTPGSEWVVDPKQIKGCNALSVTSLFSNKLLRKCGTKQDFGKICSAFYFPPWHPVAQGRKSRPALIAFRGPGEQFNGNVPQQEMRKRKSSKSMNPFDYAVWRLKSIRMYRRALWELCQVDGVYVVNMRKVPTLEDARNVISQFSKTVQRSNLNWAETQSNSLDLARMNTMLERTHNVPMPSYLKRSMWELNRKDPQRRG